MSNLSEPQGWITLWFLKCSHGYFCSLALLQNFAIIQNLSQIRCQERTFLPVPSLKGHKMLLPGSTSINTSLCGFMSKTNEHSLVTLKRKKNNEVQSSFLLDPNSATNVSPDVLPHIHSAQTFPGLCLHNHYTYQKHFISGIGSEAERRRDWVCLCIYICVYAL